MEKINEQLGKLLADIRNMDQNLRFEELKKVLNAYGYKGDFPSKGSSHCVFRKAGEQNIVIPVHRSIKRHYVELAKRVVDKEEDK